MTPEEMALEASKIEMWKDALKIGIPSIVALISAAITANLSLKLKSVDKLIAESENNLKEELSKLESHHSSLSSLLDRKRGHIESASEHYEIFANSMAIFYTQVIAKLTAAESEKTVPQEVENRVSEYEAITFSSYADANKAKRILELIGCNAAADGLIKLMTHATTARNDYQQLCRGEKTISSNEYNANFQAFRNLGKDFLKELNMAYESLVVSNNTDEQKP